MRVRKLAFMLAFVPVLGMAQGPVKEVSSAQGPLQETLSERLDPTPLTEKLLMAQRPASIPVEQWAKMIREPVNATLYPIRLTQAMLDTLDASQLDLRYQYVMVPLR